MNELIDRQFLVMRQAIDSYRANHMHLNSLIQRIQGIGEIIGSGQWRDAIFPFILEMEQINADALNAEKALTEKDKSDVEQYLLEIEGLITRFDTQGKN